MLFSAGARKKNKSEMKNCDCPIRNTGSLWVLLYVQNEYRYRLNTGLCGEKRQGLAQCVKKNKDFYCFCLGIAIKGHTSTRNSLAFVNTTAIAYIQKVGRSLKTLVYAIAVVFTNVRELRVRYPPYAARTKPCGPLILTQLWVSPRPFLIWTCYLYDGKLAPDGSCQILEYRKISKNWAGLAVRRKGCFFLFRWVLDNCIGFHAHFDVALYLLCNSSTFLWSVLLRILPGRTAKPAQFFEILRYS